MPASSTTGSSSAAWWWKAGATSSASRGSATQDWMPNRRFTPPRSAASVRSLWAMPRPAVIQFTAPGRMGWRTPSVSRCRISPS